MGIDYLYVVGVSARPAEDDSPLIIDPYRMEVLPLPLQPFETIARGTRKIAELRRVVQIQQLPPGGATKIGWESFRVSRRPVIEEIPGHPIAEGLDHVIILSEHDNRGEHFHLSGG